MLAEEPASWYRVANSLDDALSALRELEGAERIGLDVETAPAGEGTPRYRPGLDPLLSRVRLIQLSDGRTSYVLDCTRVSPVPWLMWLRNHAGRVVAHNARFDLSHLMGLGLSLPGAWDTMLADQLLRPGEPPAGLAELAERVLGERLDKTERASDWSGELSPSQLEYAARDALVLPRLARALDERLKRERLSTVSRLEFGAVGAFAMLSRTGLVLDVEGWESVRDRAEAELAALEQELARVLPTGARQGRLFGEQDRVDPWSPRQVLEALRRLGLDLPSTDEHHLRECGHPVAALLLRHRDLATRLKMFLRPMTGYVHPKTGRIHAEYWQLGAASGRTTSSDPNVQQLPRDRETRGLLTAGPGRALIIADYSQIELRIAAELAKETRMIEAFERGEDVHARTAALLTGKDPSQVTKEERQLAKAANFGLLYGMQSRGLRSYALDGYGVRLSEGEAEELRQRFFAAYPRLGMWHREAAARAKRLGHARTLGGRKRPFERVSLTTATNTPVQGTGADILKAALASAFRLCQGRRWEIVAEVHDEIVLECPEDEGAEAARLLKGAMEEAGRRFLRRVPVEVDAHVGRTWADK